jgi:hypothetical protein
MRVFILAFDYNVLPRKTMLDFLDKQPAIRNWRATMGAIFIAADLDVTGLSDLIRNGFPGQYFVAAELHSHQTQGWSDQQTWDFINNPKPCIGK